MKRNYKSDGAKPDRKTVERNRRMHMKSLCFKLSSLIPNYHHLYQHSSNNSISLTQDISSPFERLDHAAVYIKQLKERIDSMKIRKQQLIMSSVQTPSDDVITSGDCSTLNVTSLTRMPILELRDLGSSLEVVLITGLNKNFMFYQIIAVLEEEGAEVVNASFSIVGDKVMHTIHSQVTSSRVGIDVSSISERLKDLVYN
ncbi:hypothetical protein Scep_021343 [Stephania cephalantha]|uniref:BHLH domain-containing protein n=1 Tax=Stephania cephalantha TaxID=152367 RepID=A0AAP0FDD2_9MAGN